MDHSTYDKRRYPILEVREGYRAWVRTYEQTVQDEMDLRLLDRLQTVDWSTQRSALDLACGTGRVGIWLRQRSGTAIDGVDVTPEMLDIARTKGVYRTLRLTDITDTGLPAETYELCLQSLADEHLPDLGRCTARRARHEAWRLLRHRGISPSLSPGGDPHVFRPSAGRIGHHPQLRAPPERPREGRPRLRMVSPGDG